MLDMLYFKLTDPQFLLSTLVAIATMLTILTVAMPLIESDSLSQRMKSVATERERIRARVSDLSRIRPSLASVRRRKHI
jgi:tight adherence protein C